MVRDMGILERHEDARREADERRIANAQEWLDIVTNIYDGSKTAERELAQAKEQLQRAKDESDFYNENRDEIAQTRDMQQRMGKKLL